MRTKYYNDGIIGNQKVTASFTEKGELLRLFFDSVDYKQLIDTYHIAIKVNDSASIYLHDDVNNIYHQEYVKDTNILKTEVINTYFNVGVTEYAFVPLDENMLIRTFKVKNNSKNDLNISLLAYSKLLTNINNDSCGLVKNDTLVQYNHDYAVCTFAKEVLDSYQINGVDSSFPSGNIGGKDYVGMSPESGIKYNLESFKPGEEKTINICILVNDNSKKNLLSDLDNEIIRIRKKDIKKELEKTEKYWKKYLKEHDKLNLNKNSNISQKVKSLYNRTILLFPLIVNSEVGGISAGIETDEYKTKCGRYSYCWPRDGAFITRAFDIVGMEKETEKFYTSFCKKTQNKNGNWEQRFYTDGHLAPSWGYQIDETASVIFGVYDHYKKTKSKEFLKDCLKMCENAVIYLEKYVDDILSRKYSFQKSYDLWEEYEGISLYSISTIFGAYSAAIEMFSDVKVVFEEKNRLKIEALNKKIKNLENQRVNLKQYALKEFYDDEKKTYIRNRDDKKIDISVLGTVYPFKMFTAKEKNVINTVEKINMTLRTFTGGYIRYEGDTYMGGYNPWPIATCWMALYNLEAGNEKEAIENFKFVINSVSDNGLLGEQVNNDTMKPCWILGLTWSHAMFIIVLEELLNRNLL